MSSRLPRANRRGVVRSFVLAGTLAAASACGGGTPQASVDGTKQMADTLAAIYERSAADPTKNPFMNKERVAALARQVAGQVGPTAMQGQFLLAQEQLLAGQTREAIAGLEAIEKGAGLQLNAQSPQNKPFFDLLGIAYLRLGEQENCATNSAANVCILPLAAEAQHVREEGARKAIGIYERMLRAFPDDRGSQYLLNIAHMAVGGYPQRVPKPYLVPGLNTRRDKSFPTFPNIAPSLGLAINGLSGGLSVEDFNGDGHLDLFMTAWGLTDPVHLFLADGNGGYVDRTEAAGLKGIFGGLNCTHADYDNDGDSDILIMRGAWLGDAGMHPVSLLRNRGDATFEDVTFAAGLATFHPTHSAAWGDYNLDGNLDLFIGHESQSSRGGKAHPSELFVNNGNGTFSEVSAKVGITLDGFVKGVAWGDVNNDGLPDLYASAMYGPNHLFINRGGSSPKSWRFEDSPAGNGAAKSFMSFPMWFWDFDNDGWEDLLALSYDIRNTGSLHEAFALELLGQPVVIPQNDGTLMPVDRTHLYRNKGDGTFTDVAKETGLADRVIFAMGSNFGDLDNDGWFDFYVGTGNPDLRSVIPNRMFRGVDGKGFQEVSLEGGFAHIQKGHATAFVDFDRDGDEDVYMVMGGAYQGDNFSSVLYENPGWPGRNWITLLLQGTTANRSAIGARVAIEVSDANGARRTVHRTVGTGGSFGAGTLQMHVGLGPATKVEQVRVTWPDAAHTKTSYLGLEVNKTYQIVQNKEPVALVRPHVPFRRSAAAPHQMDAPKK